MNRIVNILGYTVSYAVLLLILGIKTVIAIALFGIACLVVIGLLYGIGYSGQSLTKNEPFALAVAYPSQTQSKWIAISFVVLVAACLLTMGVMR